MDFVRPPTDNLYKFLAVFGLALLGLSVVVWNNTSMTLKDKIRENEIEVVFAIVEYEQWASKNAISERFWAGIDEQLRLIIVRFDEILRSSDEIKKEERDSLAENVASLLERKGVYASRDIHAYMTHAYEQMGKSMPALVQQSFANMERDIESAEQEFGVEMALAKSADKGREISKAHERQVRELKRDQWIINWGAFVMFGSGCVIAYLGFVKWYPFQKMQDSLLELQLDNARAIKDEIAVKGDQEANA